MRETRREPRLQGSLAWSKWYRTTYCRRGRSAESISGSARPETQGSGEFGHCCPLFPTSGNRAPHFSALAFFDQMDCFRFARDSGVRGNPNRNSKNWAHYVLLGVRWQMQLNDAVAPLLCYRYRRYFAASLDPLRMATIRTTVRSLPLLFSIRSQ